MNGLPTEPLSGHCTRRWPIDSEDVAKEPEVLCRDGLGRQDELAADDFGDRAHGVALVGPEAGGATETVGLDKIWGSARRALTHLAFPRPTPVPQPCVIR